MEKIMDDEKIQDEEIVQDNENVQDENIVQDDKNVQDENIVRDDENVQDETKLDNREVAGDFLQGGLSEIKELILAFNQKESCATQINQASDIGKKLEKELQQENENAEKDVQKSVLQEQNNFTLDEDNKLTQKKKQLKEVQGKRSKAKEKGIKNRISEKTADLVEENKSLHRLVRKTLKENGLPTYCDSNWFYTMYNPQGALEWLIRIAVFFVGIFFLPYIILNITDPWWFFKFFLWIIMDVVFLAVYITIYLLSKDKDSGTLEEMREHRDKIHDNEKKIKEIKKDIKEDNDESGYNLEDFDAQIEVLTQDIEELNNLKQEKINQFNEERKQSVEDQVRQKHQIIIAGIEVKIKEQLETCNNLTEQLNQIDTDIKNKYEKYLTQNYTTKDAALRISDLLENGNVQTIGEALEIIKK